jgi:predicted RNA methylase
MLVILAMTYQQKFRSAALMYNTSAQNQKAALPMFKTLFKSRASAHPLSLNTDGTDNDFDLIYPRGIRRMAEQHFTPLHVAKKAAAFLAPGTGVKVLDIGSGAGKFCLTGAVTTRGSFVGIEQRADLVGVANSIASRYGINNAHFIHANIMTIQFSEFDAFYFFNPFYENVRTRDKMDNEVLMSPSLYSSYSSYTRGQLSELSRGTRLATYYTSPVRIPKVFEQVEALEEGNLLLWEKRS